jgi:hypothetical protein
MKNRQIAEIPPPIGPRLRGKMILSRSDWATGGGAKGFGKGGALDAMGAMDFLATD